MMRNAFGIESREVLGLPNWSFAQDAAPRGILKIPGISTWNLVTVPQTFRQSGQADNTASWYRHKLTRTTAEAGRRLILRQVRAGTVRAVQGNGRKVERHFEPYTAAFDLTLVKSTTIPQAKLWGLHRANPATVRTEANASPGRWSVRTAILPASCASVVWRDHELNRADATLWTKTLHPGESVKFPGHAFNHVLLIQPLTT